MLSHRPVAQVAALTGLVAGCSAFMNNIGALALFMPLALQICQQDNRPTSEVLMPLSFGSLLGGLMTLIGTPPNVIIATYRQELTGEAFGMFAFTPVGLGVALVGVAFISLLGWRLLPNRMGAKPGTLFDITAYITETRLPEIKLVGKELREIEQLGKGDVSILALVRGNRRLLAPVRFELLRADDLLILEGHSDALKALVVEAGLEIGNGQDGDSGRSEFGTGWYFRSGSRPGSRIEGRSAAPKSTHERFGVNLMALSRQGENRCVSASAASPSGGMCCCCRRDKNHARQPQFAGLSALGAAQNHFGATPTTDARRLYFHGLHIFDRSGNSAGPRGFYRRRHHLGAD
ncbi:MAG: SLC13 family permease [Candidatus Competibacteraceae bacterium]